MRQYGEVPPVLNTDPAPAVSGLTGLGTGGGAGVSTRDGTGFGEVMLQVGSNPSVGGNVSITFASTPPTLFISGSEGLGTLTQATSGNIVTITWTRAPRANSRERIQYEWFSSF